ncbi:serine/threonine-protein phosphatase 2A regulatory subunit B'' subunit gamma-like [Protopterus annectens]|uniref:serine/threonine-protein phosphatase 2A regulatory subunit B'' subunit gamma-like n=1 Tax=Protopterus annectens TaxID=7888 RepID=UPI001CFA4737|nr:serine/threonine-protein phosphatase 2A regulatory subunit B'' subunit gamma-like [Protopterus annectens]
MTTERQNMGFPVISDLGFDVSDFKGTMEKWVNILRVAVFIKQLYMKEKAALHVILDTFLVYLHNVDHVLPNGHITEPFPRNQNGKNFQMSKKPRISTFPTTPHLQASANMGKKEGPLSLYLFFFISKGNKKQEEEKTPLIDKYYAECKENDKRRGSYKICPRFYRRIELSMYDAIGQGYLRESDLEKYIEELIPTLPQLNGLDENFKLIYICTVSRKFFFFLDPLRTGDRRIKILDILASGFLDEMFQLKDEDLSEERQASNWFSFNSMMKLFVQYLDLDKDCNGTLSRDELSHYGMGSLTNVFLDRVFQECLTSNGEMDYKTYLDFVLAMTSGDNPTALHYIFRLLDIEKKGSLNAFTLNYLFKGIQEKLSERGWEQISFLDVKDEVFDMINPKDPYRITYKDLVNSGEGNTFIGIFIDVFAFKAYDNR